MMARTERDSGMSDTGEVTLERRGRIGLITISRPGKRNALSQAMWASLRAALAELGAQPPRAVVVTGAGDAFCAGMDVSLDNPHVADLVTAAQTHDQAPMKRLLRELRSILDALSTLPVPVISAVNGLAYGGGAEIAVRSDLRVMDPAATICFSEVRLGLMPDLGGCVALTRLIGRGRAADLILTARPVGAKEAFDLGIANRISAPGRCLDEALELGAAIARNGPRAVRASLEVIRATLDLTEEQALGLEQDRAAELMASGECTHGVTALFSKTEPEFPDPEPG